MGNAPYLVLPPATDSKAAAPGLGRLLFRAAGAGSSAPGRLGVSGMAFPHVVPAQDDAPAVHIPEAGSRWQRVIFPPPESPAMAVAMALLLTIVWTNYYLTRSLFRHISRPLDALTAGVARIRDGDLDTPIAYREADEFKAACDAVDEMAARLKASLEEQRQARQKKQALIAGISHDQKSPLPSIRAYTEALLEGAARDEDARQRYLQTIRAKEGDMETMVNRLFAFAKMDASTYPLRREPLPLGRTLAELTGERDTEGMEIRLEIPEALRVMADRELLSRITANLLRNSRKYGGRETLRVTVSARKWDGMAEVCFADDGAGAAETQLPRLFDAFSRLYLYVHFPSDILDAAVPGIGIGCLTFRWGSRALNRRTPLGAGR